jgi:hypothetical protein
MIKYLRAEDRHGKARSALREARARAGLAERP